MDSVTLCHLIIKKIESFEKKLEEVERLEKELYHEELKKELEPENKKNKYKSLV